MTTLLTHRLPGGDDPITYAPCKHPPFAAPGWWFVTLPASVIARGPAADVVPAQDHTFIVPWQRATPPAMDQLGGDVDTWTDVAHRVFVGEWCPRYECLWIDVPVYTTESLIFRSRARYGYCRTQPDPDRYPDRELWYVAFEAGSTFVVDHVCAQPSFMRRMGVTTLKWRIICWQELGSEVVWDSLIAGQRGGGPVREDPALPLDSRYIPPDLDTIYRRIDTYEARIADAMATNRPVVLGELLQGMMD